MTPKRKNENTNPALDKDFNIEQMMPKDFVDHYMIRKPIGVRVHKEDCRITHVLQESKLFGKAFVGDSIVGVDEKNISTSDELYAKLKEKKENVHMQIRRNMFSWCFHLKTTVEKIQIDKEAERITSTPVNHYFVLIRMRPTPELKTFDLGMLVMYNNRDRLEIEYVAPNSLAAVHLKAGDVIRECNSQPICSKIMLRSLIASSIATSGQITLLIEAPTRDIVRDHIEVAEDVVQIADRAAEDFKKTMRSYVTQPRKKQSQKKTIKVKEDRTEHRIVSDSDPTKLRPCKNAS